MTITRTVLLVGSDLTTTTKDPLEFRCPREPESRLDRTFGSTTGKDVIVRIASFVSPQELDGGERTCDLRELTKPLLGEIEH